MLKPRTSTPTMVVGIVGASLGLLFGWLLPFIPLILGVIGLLLLRGVPGDGKRTTGLVLGIVNTVLGGLWSLWFLVMVLAVTSEGSY